MTNELLEIGARIEHAMKSAGLERADLADLLGVGVGAIGKYIRGASDAGIVAIRKIAERCEVSLDYLIKGTDNPPEIKFQVNETNATYENKTIDLDQDEVTVIGQLRILPNDKKIDIIKYLSYLVAKDEIDKMS